MNRGAKIISIALLMLLPLVVSASSYIAGTYDLKGLSKEADAILIGKCVEKESYWTQGHIETRVVIEVSEYLKGDLGKKVTITQMGGELSEPIPLGLYVTGMPHFLKGEEVLLFVRRPSSAQSKAVTADSRRKISSALINSPSVVGRNKGKLTILTDKETGEKRLLPGGCEELGFVPRDDVARKLYSTVVSRAKKGAPRPERSKQRVENILHQAPGQVHRPSEPEEEGTPDSKAADEAKEASAAATAPILAVPDFSHLAKLDEIKGEIKNFIRD